MTRHHWDIQSVSSVTQSCPTLCDPMNCSTPGLPVHHKLPEFTQTHAHQVGDAIQPSHPVSSPFPPVPNPSQHQGFFQWVNSLHEVAKVLEFQLSWGAIYLLCWCPLKRWSHSLCPLDSTCSLWYYLILPLPAATELDFSFAFLLLLRYLTLFPFRCKEFWTCQNSILFSYSSNL